MDWDSAYIEGLITAALTEDIGSGDAAVTATVFPERVVTARMVAGQELVCAGLPLVDKILSRVDPEISVETKVAEGRRVAAGAVVAEVNGNAGAILSGGQTVLNFLSRLCGVATQTRDYVDRIGGVVARIRDSRSTTPGLRQLEQYAVRVGGGTNSRAGLYDALGLTQEHIRAAGGVKAALDQAHSHASRLMTPLPLTAYEATGTVPSETEASSLPIQIAIQDEQQLREALSAGADSVLFEEMSPQQVRRLAEVARNIRHDCVLEVSGEIPLELVGAYAATGVDYIAPRGLIRSAPAVDLRLLVDGWQ